MLLYIIFGPKIKDLWDFLDFSQSLGKLIATTNVAKSEQTCPKLPKCAQRQLKNFEKSPKTEILVFSKNNPPHVEEAKAYSHHSDFEYRTFGFFFCCQIVTFVREFQHIPCAK
jgi:hypothetical protein